MVDGKDLVSSRCIKGRKEEKRETMSLFLPLPKRLCACQIAFPYSSASSPGPGKSALGTRLHIPLRESCENKSVATGYESAGPAADKLSISRAREASRSRSRAIERRSLSQIR